MCIAHETDCFLSLDKYIRMYHAYVHDTYTDRQTPPPTMHTNAHTPSPMQVMSLMISFAVW